VTAVGGLFLGVDAGATKTTTCVCDAQGTVRALATGGSGAWEAIGAQTAAAGITACVQQALRQAGAAASDLTGSAFGVAGLDWPEDTATVAEMLAPLGLPHAPVLVNDAFAALRAGVDDNTGCVSCAGTGSVTAARAADGRTFQTYAVGWGEQSGAIGLVEAALDAVVGAHYGSAPATLLTGLLLDAVDADSVDEAVQRATREGRPFGPELAPLVLDAAALDDPAALAIATAAGATLASTAAAAAGRLGLERGPFAVVRSGGVHLAGSRSLDEAFRLTLHAQAPTARVIDLSLPPAAGAALLALDAEGLSVSIAALEGSLPHGVLVRPGA
jgi:N-acetylglucosamine kinase-like BadF-type ATPase